MRRLLWLSCFIACCVTAAFGQVPMTGAGLAAPSSAAGYSGPGNVQSGALAWWGLRAYSAAKAGNAAIDICEPTGVTCVTWSTSASTGKLVVGTNPVGGTDCTVSTSCVISKLYDQTQGTSCGGSACDLTNATNSQRPTLNWNSGTPFLSCVGASSQNLANSSGITNSQPLSLSFVAERKASFNNFQDIIDSNGATGTIQFGFGGGNNQALLYAGTVQNATAADSAFHAVQGLYNGASSALYVDGTNTGSLSPGSGTLTGAVSICGPANFADSNFDEGGAWNGDKSATFSTLNTNQHSFWGF